MRKGKGEKGRPKTRSGGEATPPASSGPVQNSVSDEELSDQDNHDDLPDFNGQNTKDSDKTKTKSSAFQKFSPSKWEVFLQIQIILVVLWHASKHGVVLDEALNERLKAGCDKNLEDLSSCINHLLTPQSKDIKLRKDVDDIVRDLKAIQNKDLFEKESDVLKFLAQWDVDFKAGGEIVTKSDLQGKVEGYIPAIMSENSSKVTETRGDSAHQQDSDQFKGLETDVAELQKWKTSLSNLKGLNVREVLDDHKIRLKKLEGQTGDTEDIDLEKDSKLNSRVDMLMEGLQSNFTQMNSTLNQHGVLMLDIYNNVTDLNEKVLSMKQNVKDLRDKVNDHKMEIDGKLDAHDKRIRVVQTDLPQIRRDIISVNETAVNAFDVANGTKVTILKTVDDHKKDIGGQLNAHGKRISALVDTDLPDIKRGIGLANGTAVNAFDLASETKQGLTASNKSIEVLQQNVTDLADRITKK